MKVVNAIAVIIAYVALLTVYGFAASFTLASALGLVVWP
jgi:hypothetical protein